MKTASLTTLVAAASAGLLLCGSSATAQDATPAPSAPPAATPAVAAASPAASPSNVDRMEQFRQRMNERIKTELKVSDEEWSVIQPLLEKVQTKMRDANPRMFGFGGGGRNRGPGGQGGPGGNNNGFGGASASASASPRPPRPGGPEMDALRAALASDDTSPADIQAKLAALRDTRKKSLAELASARQDLVKVLTQRQEATLVMMGILE